MSRLRKIHSVTGKKNLPKPCFPCQNILWLLCILLRIFIYSLSLCLLKYHRMSHHHFLIYFFFPSFSLDQTPFVLSFFWLSYGKILFKLISLGDLILKGQINNHRKMRTLAGCKSQMKKWKTNVLPFTYVHSSISTDQTSRSEEMQYVILTKSG